MGDNGLAYPTPMTLAFEVVTDDCFPWGFRCAVCHRVIWVGQPYQALIRSVDADGTVMSVLACVYCDHDTEETT